MKATGPRSKQSRDHPAKSILLFATAVLPASSSTLCADELRVAPVFTSQVVRQRNEPVPVWGLAAPGEAVTVAFAGRSLGGKPGRDHEKQQHERPSIRC